MSDSQRYFNSFMRHAHMFDGISESHSDFEKYVSLLSSLKGFEEYTLDRTGLIISSNLEAVTITGYEEWEVIGKHISIFYSLEDQFAGKPHDDLERAQQRSPLVITGLRVKKRNASFWAKIRLRTLLENNLVIGYKMTLQDATHKAVSNHRLREFKDEYLSLFNNSFMGIFKFSMNDYCLLMANDKALKLTGLGSVDSGKPLFSDIFQNPDDFRHAIAQLRSNKRLEEFEFQVKNENRWLKVSCRYFYQRNFMEGIVVDTTAEKKNKLEADRLRHELDQFIYHASHELRAPLVSMLGIINLIKIEGDLPTAQQLSAVLRDKVNQLDSLLKSITSIAYNNKTELTPDPIDWEKILRSLLKELEPMTNDDIHISYTIDQEGPFFSDVPRIRTILKNVIANALKHFNPVAEHRWVSIQVKTNPWKADINVADNGIGIDQRYLDDIFKMFYKATESPKGPGLGLYVVKAMIEKLEGTIRVESSPGSGTAFILSIPNINSTE